MISPLTAYRLAGTKTSFSAIARSVMISPSRPQLLMRRRLSFSAIARSVMISPGYQERYAEYRYYPFQCYSS